MFYQMNKQIRNRKLVNLNKSKQLKKLEGTALEKVIGGRKILDSGQAGDNVGL